MEQTVDQGTNVDMMTGGMQKKNTGLIAGMVVCAVLAVSGIAFGIYGVMQSSQKDNQISDLKVQVADKDGVIATLETEKNETTKEDGITTTAADSSASAYELFSSNLANNYKGSVFGYYSHWTGSDSVKRTMVANVDDNSHLKIMDADNNGQVIAEADDIISVYFIEVGNGGVPYFYMINKDGKVSRISISENDARTIENINEYNDVVSVIQGGDLYAWIIDIEGNLYKTY